MPRKQNIRGDLSANDGLENVYYTLNWTLCLATGIKFDLQSAIFTCGQLPNGLNADQEYKQMIIGMKYG